MKTIQIITLRGQPAAIAVNGTAVIAQHVPDDELALVQAKALYALEIQAGTRPGPYTDPDAESYARHAAVAQAPPPARSRASSARRRGGHRRRPLQP